MAEATIDRDEERLEFVPPGPGSWAVDKTHVTRPATTFHHETVPGPFNAAFQRMFERYGIPAGGNEQALIHGFVYSRVTPLPPEQFGSRLEAADAAVASRLWRLDLARWDEEVKPASIRRHLELAAIVPAGLDDAALAEHVGICADHVAAMIAQHHEFNGANMVPLGDFLASAMEWTGLPTARLLELFAGASPTSTGSCPELEAVCGALRDDETAVALVRDEAADPAEVVARLRREVRPATVRAVDGWLDLVGHRITDGFDVDQPTALERPGVLVSCLRRALDERPAPDVAAKVAEVRALVPEEQREAFDDRYREAFDLYRLRDERGIYSDSGAFGLMRRAMLEVGDRLVRRGALADRELALEAGRDELVALLDGAGEPTSDELAARRRRRHRWSVADAPAAIGDPPGPPPPFDLLPPAMGRMARAVVTFAGNMSSTPPAAADDGSAAATGLTGLPGSPGVHEGHARVVRSVDDLERVEEGDVIVAITTAESFNLALSLASAVVTDQGGLLSHAAILAREYGIPAVVGTEHATRRIPDGARVRVDGSTGEVTW